MIISEDIVRRLKALDIEDVAAWLGITIERHAAVCFMHDDHEPSLKFNVEKNIFHCFVCNKGGDTIKLVQEYHGLTFQDACVLLGRQFKVWNPNENIRIKSSRRVIRKFHLHKPKESECTFDAEIFSWIINNAKLSETANSFLFDERHFDKGVIEKLRIKSLSYPKRLVDLLIGLFGEERCVRAKIVRQCVHGLYCFFFTPCLLFPYYEKDGKLVGLQSRYLGDNKKAPRFQFISSQKTRLFNLPVLNSMTRGDELFISEGITDCLALLSSGKRAVAIPSATILPVEDLAQLKNYDLHMYPDADEAGRRAFSELRRFFVNQYSFLTSNKLPEGVKDYCDYFVQSAGNV